MRIIPKKIAVFLVSSRLFFYDSSTHPENKTASDNSSSFIDCGKDSVSATARMAKAQAREMTVSSFS